MEFALFWYEAFLLKDFRRLSFKVRAEGESRIKIPMTTCPSKETWSDPVDPVVALSKTCLITKSSLTNNLINIRFATVYNIV